MGRLEGLLDRLDGTVDTEELGGTLQHFDGKEYLECWEGVVGFYLTTEDPIQHNLSIHSTISFEALDAMVGWIEGIVLVGTLE